MAAKLARSQRTAGRGSRPEPGRALLKVGDLLAHKYKVTRVLGEGGMGVVVEAYHELLEQRVAVKLLYQDVADREAQSRLLREARACAKIQSDHVARVVDVDVGANGLPFIVMELLEGADLCAVMDRGGALPPWVVVDYMLQALEGLAHAHGRGIIHRDLKPSNLFLTNLPDGSQIIKILDFGISKSQQTPDRRVQQLTGGRSVLGSPPYMSPEQVRSPKSVDHRTDIWSLGICMYELLTNAMPFGGDEVQETFAHILERQPTPIRALAPKTPDGLEAIIMRCLSKKREDRFTDVSELAAAIVPYGTGNWAKSAERCQATLARALMEDISGTSRARPDVVSDSFPIPSTRRVLDSLQPELNGTANTVALGFESKKRFIIGLCAVMVACGIFLIGATLIHRQRAATFSTSSEPVPVPVDPVSAVDPSMVGVGGEGEPSPLPPGTLIGASPFPPELAASMKPKAPSAPAARPSPGQAQPPSHGDKKTASAPPTPPPAPATNATTSPNAGSGSKLPAGLPMSRSGQ